MKTAQASSSNCVMRALALGSALGLTALTAALYLGTPAEAVRPYDIRDECTQTSGKAPPGLECNSAEDVLIRVRWADGTCSNWICCPKNSDGSLNCEAGSTPSGEQLSSRVRNLLGSRYVVATPGQTARRPRAPAAAAPTQTRK